MTFFINPGIPGRKYFLKSIKLEEGKTYFICKECNLMAPDELNIAIVHIDRSDNFIALH